MNSKDTRIYNQYESTLSCEAAIETTTFGTQRSMRALYLVPTEREITTKEASDFSPIQEENAQEVDFIAASNQAYAKLAPNERHELDIWDVTLDDGLDEY